MAAVVAVLVLTLTAAPEAVLCSVVRRWLLAAPGVRVRAVPRRSAKRAHLGAAMSWVVAARLAVRLILLVDLQARQVFGLQLEAFQVAQPAMRQVAAADKGAVDFSALH